MFRWFFKLTGGRPMKYVSSLFFDSVSGESVNLYIDRHKQELWMANSGWNLFRVKKSGK
jgi:hypothetical protein